MLFLEERGFCSAVSQLISRTGIGEECAVPSSPRGFVFVLHCCCCWSFLHGLVL